MAGFRAFKTNLHQVFYRSATRLIGLFAPALLRTRSWRGKEDPKRMAEKRGLTRHVRPSGRLVWLHGVGLGEVLSTRAVIHAMSMRDPTLNFLVTSSTKISAEVFARHMPDRTIHQFLPLDSPKFIKRFLNHWSPSMSIWIEQDFWPGLIKATHDRNIPLVLLNGRMNEHAFQKRRKAKTLFQPAYQAFALLAAQDAESRDNIAALAEREVQLHPNLKIMSPPLNIDEAEHQVWQTHLKNRFVWCVGAAHLTDVDVALQAHKSVLAMNADATLIVIPRFPADLPAMRVMCREMGLGQTTTSQPKARAVMWEDRFGMSGLWFSLSHAALIGGSFDATHGHNPWEAVHLNCPIVHGPEVANFQSDYALLEAAHGTQMVQNAQELFDWLRVTDFQLMAESATWVVKDQSQAMRPTFDKIYGMIP